MDVQMVSSNGSLLLGEHQQPLRHALNLARSYREDRVKGTAVHTARQVARCILDSVSDAVLILDRTKKVLNVNSAFCGLFGVQREQAVGHLVGEVEALRGAAKWFGTDPLPDVREHVMNGDVEGKPPRHLQVRASTYEDETGQCVGTVWVLRDVTAERHAEQSRQAFLAIVSHELRGPLSALRGFSEILLDRSLPDEKRQRFLRYINAQSIMLANIVSDLLDLSQLEVAGLTGLTFNRCSVEAICRAEAESAQRLTTIHDVDVSGLQHIPDIMGDERRVAQIVRNLLTNAVRFSPAGGAIEVACEANSRWAVITVRDHGIGLTPEQAARVLDKFFHHDVSTTAALGVGLSIVRQLVRCHGGAMWVETEPGVGTTARVALPLAEAQPLVLVVGSVYPSVSALAQEFAKAGWHVIQANAAEQGLIAARDELPSVTVLALPVGEQDRIAGKLFAEQCTADLLVLSLVDSGDALDVQRVGGGGRIETVKRETTPKDLVDRAIFLRQSRRTAVGLPLG